MEVPVSLAQERLWLAEQAAGGQAARHLSSAWWLDGPLDAGALQRALDGVVARHGALRTSIVAVNGMPRQVVADDAGVPIEWLTVVGNDHAAQAESIAAARACRPFDLAQGPLLRAALIRAGAGRHLFVLVFHRLVCDRLGRSIVLHELSTLYGGSADLPDLWMDYPDYAVWQRDRLRGEELGRQRDYWVGQLLDAPQLRGLPHARPDRAGPPAPDGARTESLGAATVRRLAELAEREQTTVPVAALTGFAIVLAGCGRQDEVVIAIPASGRTHAELRPVVGTFTNPVAVRINLAGAAGFLDQLARVRDARQAALALQELPFGALVSQLPARRGAEHPALVRVHFVDKVDDAPPLPLAGLTARPAALDPPGTDVDLTLYADCHTDRVTLTLAYRPECCDAGWTDRVLGCVVRLLDHVAAAPHASGADLLDLLRPWLWAAPPEDIPADPAGLPGEAVPAAHTATEAPATAQAPTPDPTVPPEVPTPVEATLAGIWRELIPGAATVGGSDNLFALGASSLTTIWFIGRVAETFGVELAVHQVFDHPTIAELAVMVAELVVTTAKEPESAATHGYAPVEAG